MPIYEYDCGACGPFSESRPMSASALPAPCPRCAAESRRVLSAPAVGRTRAGRAARGRREPTLVKHDREPPKPKLKAAHGDRPWMIGH